MDQKWYNIIHLPMKCIHNSTVWFHLMNWTRLDKMIYRECKGVKNQYFVEELRRMLTQERVNKTGSISEGIWEEDHHRVRITRVEGKWQSYGYEDSTGKYVDCHEALFLMEMNRLMVKWNDVMVSIEQGYSLFLGQPNSLTMEQYQVYSVLNRASYYVLRYDPARQYRTEVNDLPSAEERCVWGNLYEMLHQPNPRETSDTRANTKLYETVRRSMRKYNNLITKPSAVKDQEDDGGDAKEPVHKRNKLEFHKLPAEHDCFNMIERFRRIFDRFDIVRSMTEEHRESFEDQHGSNQAADPGSLQLVFDLFAPESQSFKKTNPPLPIARIIVRRSSETMPYFRELQDVYYRQSQRVPLMLMLVSDSLSVHCFLYDMTRVARNIITLPTDSSCSSK
uniref:tRNA-splicing endonuclease subunit Sen54 N-terminal domain-containing protein n=1 Tax=Anopheles atroparvus TaxID=41427 RepID=A0AAG5DBJ1_ANOAO